MSVSDTGTGVEEAPATDRDAAPRALLAELTEALGQGGVIGSEVRNGDLWVRVATGDWKRAAQACRDMGFDYFCFLSGIDWMQSTSPNPRASVSDTVEGLEEEDGSPEPGADEPAPDAEAEPAVDGLQTGFAGGDTRFQVFARLYSTRRHQGVTLKADLVDEAPFVDSIINVYAGADWNERETWEMYGFHFVGHPNLVHLYLPGEFEGFPLRKDFPLLSREVKPWPGLVDVEPMPEVPETEEAVTAAAGGTTVTETAADAPDSDLPEGTVAVGDSAVAEEPAVRERQDPEPPADLPTTTPDAEAPTEAPTGVATTTPDFEAVADAEAVDPETPPEAPATSDEEPGA